jgi:hypothetical protein
MLWRAATEGPAAFYRSAAKGTAVGRMMNALSEVVSPIDGRRTLLSLALQPRERNGAKFRRQSRHLWASDCDVPLR